MSKLDALRTVANIETLKWASLENSDEWKPEDNIWWYNLSYDSETGEGSYLYKMGCGASSNPHEHMGPEEFFILEGDLIDSDGFEYKKGDFAISEKVASEALSLPMNPFLTNEQIDYIIFEIQKKI